ncbi:hypothetical protein EVAR_51508_1 [Eumeta japonica]|uniref:Uncharacterized protein n=1 Tax=Eumeta variegata TaxID=151549 RepID=A0A4C1XFG5_EUMVA|nr:hypothetical protein EVAR_51508_1 [Eumeta japonica]
MSHRTRERPNALRLPLNPSSAARSTRELVHSLQIKFVNGYTPELGSRAGSEFTLKCDSSCLEQNTYYRFRLKRSHRSSGCCRRGRRSSGADGAGRVGRVTVDTDRLGRAGRTSCPGWLFILLAGRVAPLALVRHAQQSLRVADSVTPSCASACAARTSCTRCRPPVPTEICVAQRSVRRYDARYLARASAGHSAPDRRLQQTDVHGLKIWLPVSRYTGKVLRDNDFEWRSDVIGSDSRVAALPVAALDRNVLSGRFKYVIRNFSLFKAVAAPAAVAAGGAAAAGAGAVGARPSDTSSPFN